MTMQESGEMYLETILILSRKNKTVRSIDIAQELNFSKAAVSRAMSKLKEDNYVIIDVNGAVSLSEKGLKIAENIYERHTILSKMLINLGVPEEIAINDACKIEHDISPETFEILKNHLNNQ